jgi:orotate phosphoribosyltransferase
MNVILHDRASRVSEIILDLGAVHCNPDKPYTLTSGWASPVYVNCRRIISATWQRREIMQLAAEHIETHVGRDQFDVIAGGETAGIPFGAWIADYFYRPMIYVRKKHKAFGLRRQIEGELIAGQRALIVEDVMTDGASKVHFANSLRAANAGVSAALVMFNYGVFPNVERNIQNANLSLYALTDWQTTLAVAVARGYFTPTQARIVQEFISDAAGWSRANGGAGE